MQQLETVQTDLLVLHSKLYNLIGDIAFPLLDGIVSAQVILIFVLFDQSDDKGSTIRARY